MSESTHRRLSDSTEMRESSDRGNRLRSATIAVIAVLAALGTLFAHHRSIEALTSKNQAILLQARASDSYAKYEARVVRYQIAQALVAANVTGTPGGKRQLQHIVDTERKSSTDVLTKAQTLEKQSEDQDVESQHILRSYEVLQTATTFFDISIVLVSISTLVATRGFFNAACALSAIGIVLMIVGFRP
jgi:Domain of unknown function (DUF4337)